MATSRFRTRSLRGSGAAESHVVSGKPIGSGWNSVGVTTPIHRFGLVPFAFALATSMACTDDVVDADDELGDTGTQEDDDTDSGDGDGDTTTDSGDGDGEEDDTTSDSGDVDGDTTTSDSGDVDGDTTTDEDENDTSSSESESSSESTDEGESTTTDEGEGESGTSSESESSDDSESTTDDGNDDFGGEPDDQFITTVDTDGDPNCGDGTVQMFEACDDGNDVAGDGCDPDCTISESIDWVAVRDPGNAEACSSIRRMALRPDGTIATVGGSHEAWNSSKLFVSTWTTEGEILAEFTHDSYVTDALYKPNLDPLPNGDLYVSRTVEWEWGSGIGAVWRLGPDLELEWMKTADQISPQNAYLPPGRYAAVLATADGGALLLGDFDPRLQKIDSQGNFVAEEMLIPTSFISDMAKVGADQAWTLRRHFQYQYWGHLERFDMDDLSEVGSDTTWAHGIHDRRFTEIEAHAGHIVALGPVGNPGDPNDSSNYAGLHRFDAQGDLFALDVFTSLGPVAVDGMAIADDGTIVVAGPSEAFGVDPDGNLLWHLNADEVDPEAWFADALFDAQGNVYLGGWISYGFVCKEAMIVKISW
jgi:cysteine-rich repeat protein